MPQHKKARGPFFTPSQLCRTNVVQNPWDRHGTKRVEFLERSHLYSPRNTGTCIKKVTLRVVSNLSFTAKFETTKPLKTLKFSGVLCFKGAEKGPYGNIHGNTCSHSPEECVALKASLLTPFEPEALIS